MQALHFSKASGQLRLQQDYAKPQLREGEALIKVLVAGICSTDLEITRGYIPGFEGVLGHEFVGRVECCPSRPDLVQQRVVGEINCNDACFSCNDAVYQRNHAPGRSVLGIINRDGCIAEFISLPVNNLHVVPDTLSDSIAVFAEPLAAACRILEQGLVGTRGADVAVIGDGKLGLLVAQLITAEGGKVTLLGRHSSKMQLVQGLQQAVVLPQLSDGVAPEAPCSDPLTELEGKFQLVIEATGSSDGVLNGLRLTGAMGILLLKSTVSVRKDGGVQWAQIANDIVVHEKTLMGSRCGPMDVALEMMAKHASIRSLLTAMTSKVFPLAEAEAAMSFAQTRGVLKVQVVP